jgi:hypothetical protein
MSGGEGLAMTPELNVTALGSGAVERKARRDRFRTSRRLQQGLLYCWRKIYKHKIRGRI